MSLLEPTDAEKTSRPGPVAPRGLVFVIRVFTERRLRHELLLCARLGAFVFPIGAAEAFATALAHHIGS
jgi:hypothetical protein